MELKEETTTGALLAAILGAALAFPAGGQLGPLGDDFQVNTYTTSSQRAPAVATEANGAFVVVWESNGSYGSDSHYSSVQLRRFDADGVGLGSDFQVNTYTTYYQDTPRVAVGLGGEFVVVWHSSGSSGPDNDLGSIQGRRFTAAGVPLGDDFQVNFLGVGNQVLPAVKLAPDGRVTVVWQSQSSLGPDNDATSIQARQFDAGGTALGPDFQVNSYGYRAQFEPALAMGEDGSFVVAWSSYASQGSDQSLTSIQARRFDAGGNPLDADDFQVNTTTTGFQTSPAVAVAGDGNFLIAWTSDSSSGSDTSASSVQARLYNATGIAAGDDFQVNVYTTSYQALPDVAVDPEARFVVSWMSNGSSGSDGSYFSTQGRVLDAAGGLGSEFQMNTYTSGYQGSPRIASVPDGRFVVAWGSDGSDGSDTSQDSVQARRFAGIAIFADGFESGDTSAWSGAVP